MEWLHTFVADCEAALDLVMTDQEAFVEFINESTEMLAGQMRRRAELR